MAGRDNGQAGASAAVCLVGLVLLAAAAPSAQAQYPEPTEPQANPCLGEQAPLLLCPDLQMGPPSGLFSSSGADKVLLHASNDIRSRGEGPLEIRGTRISKRYMSVRQAIRTTAGKRRLYDTPGRLIFYKIPGQGPYWKFRFAALFQIWSLDEAGNRVELLRKGPKVSYCFRDLKRTRPGPDSPGKRIYPACSQDPKLEARTLGTSVGWSDIYPSTYYQNWINVKGLRGCFELVITADPLNHLFENDEANNEGSRRVRLPAPNRGGVPSC
ncbi:MAG: hypothetical protein M3O25_01815 [Actinomycetota bacterium]|nr:hypothetical protein [Actinomycetota bacterium]